MQLSLLIRGLRYLAKGVLGLLLVAALLFVALTQTERGRQALKTRLVERFNDTYAGTLQIGVIEGTIVGSLYARDIRLMDPEGRVALKADAIELIPRWLDLLDRELTFRSVIVKDPEIYLIRSAGESYNLVRAFRQIDRPDSVNVSSSRWTVNAAQIEIRSGELHTVYQGETPASAAAIPFFNFANTTVDSLNLQATVEWGPGYKLIDIQSASAYNRDLSLSIEQLRGQFIVSNNRLSLNQILLRTAESTVAFGGSFNLAVLTDETVSDSLRQSPIHFTLASATISGSELSRIVPALALEDSFNITGQLEGTLDDLTAQLQLQSGRTRIAGKGRLRGWPDSLAFSFEFPNNTIHPEDVLSVWPHAPLKQYSHLGKTAVSLETKGMIRLTTGEQTTARPRFTARTHLTLEGAMGQVAGRVAMRKVEGQPLSYNASFTVRNGDIGAVQNEPVLASHLNGEVTIRGAGLTWDDLDAQTSINLGPSVISGRSIDSLSLALAASGQQIDAQIQLYQPNGFLYSDAAINWRGSEPSYHLYLVSRDLNIGPLVPTDTVATTLNGSVTVNARGWLSSGLRGTAQITIDSSSVYFPENNYTIRPAVSQVVLRPNNSQNAQFAVKGDLFDLVLRGDFTIGTLFETGRLWARAFHRAWRTINSKPRTHYPALSAGPLPPLYAALRTVVHRWDPPDLSRSVPAHKMETLKTHFARAGLTDGISASLDLRIKRMGLLTSLVPSLPFLQGPLQFSARWRMGLDSLTLKAELDSDALTGPRLGLQDVHADLTIEAAFDYLLAASTDIQFGLESNEIELPAQTFNDNSLTLRYTNKRAHVQVASHQIGDAGAFRTDFTVDLLPYRNRLTIHQLDFQLNNATWYNPGPQTIDLFQNAIVFHEVVLKNRLARSTGRTNSGSSIYIQGAISPRSADTAYVRIKSMDLGQLSNVLALKNPIGGILDADIAVTRAGGALATAGDLHIADLTFDGHLLGQLQANTRYRPLYDALHVDLQIAHETPLSTGIQNDLHVTGLIGLPERTTTGIYLDPGFLNLSLRIGEADLFFFEDIFPSVVDDVRAAVSGTGVIRGTFRRPVFEADLQITDGRFRLPDFNLTYTLSGPIRVDASGFHIDSTRITDPTGGTAVVWGDILFNEYQFFSFDLHGQLDRLQTINVESSTDLPFYGHIWTSGTAHLTGPLYDALLRSSSLVTTPNSELYIPVVSDVSESDEAFIVFADSTGEVPDTWQRRRDHILAERPPGERPFLEGLDMNLNIDAPRGSTVYLVFDPLLGDVVEAVGSARVQLNINDGEYTTFGTFNITGGEYLFTAGDMFSRRFQLAPGGTITWDGDPINAQLNIPATYHTRASLAGLPGRDPSTQIPVVIRLELAGRVNAPVIDLGLAIDHNEYGNTAHLTSLEPILNDEKRAAEYATSVLLTNSFRLTLTGDTEGITESVDQLAFSTLSQLVANQLNRFVSHALSNVDVNLGLQQGMSLQDLDLTYGVALYLMDERLIIRGQGIYETTDSHSASESLQGSLTVEVRLNPTVSVEVFYRREGDLLESASAVAPSYGVGVSYQTDFTNWEQFLSQQWNNWKEFWQQLVAFVVPDPTPPPSTANTAKTPPDTASTDTLKLDPIVRTLKPSIDR